MNERELNRIATEAADAVIAELDEEIGLRTRALLRVLDFARQKAASNPGPDGAGLRALISVLEMGADVPLPDEVTELVERISAPFKEQRRVCP